MLISASGRLYRRQLYLGRLLDRVVFTGLLLLLAWLPLPFGSHRPWAVQLFVILIFGLLSVQSLAWALGGLRRWIVGGGLATMFLLWFLWLAWIYFQTVPLPADVVMRWSPLRWQQVHELSAALGEHMPSQLTLSVAPDDTREAFHLSLAYVALFLLTVFCLQRRQGRIRWLLWVLLLSAVAQAVYGSFMVLTGLEYGVWGPKQFYRGFATGTFVNRNHLAGYLEVGLGAAVGLLLIMARRLRGRPDWRQRLRHYLSWIQDGAAVVRIGIAFLFIGLLLSQSRMGNVAAIASLAIVGLVYLLGARHLRWNWAVLIASILLLDIWVLGRWFRLDQLVERYSEVTTGAEMRLQLMPDIKAMSAAYGRVGSGLGTFVVAYPPFRSPAIDALVEHAHNDYAEFLIETGVVGSVLIAGLGLSTLVRALWMLLKRRDRTARGIAAASSIAIMALGIHSATDFNLQIPANAASLVVLMGAVWASSRRNGQTRQHG